MRRYTRRKLLGQLRLFVGRSCCFVCGALNFRRARRVANSPSPKDVSLFFPSDLASFPPFFNTSFHIVDDVRGKEERERFMNENAPDQGSLSASGLLLLHRLGLGLLLGYGIAVGSAVAAAR